MNEQKPPYGIEWTRIQRPDGTRTKGYTWNPVSGCLHRCEWSMPDGSTAECYAKGVAERVARSAYPGGFEVITFHPERLPEPLRVKRSAGIFLDSMSDIMGHWLPEDQIVQVLDVVRLAHWHIFFSLTKNAPRLTQVARFAYPPNMWIGASSPPDSMFGHPLSRSQQRHMLDRMLRTLADVAVPVRWMSFEPLSWDCADIVAAYPGVLQWAVIGAASDGQRVYPPDAAVLQRLLAVLDGQGVPVFYKGNLRALPAARTDWRAAFPQGDALWPH